MSAAGQARARVGKPTRAGSAACRSERDSRCRGRTPGHRGYSFELGKMHVAVLATELDAPAQNAWLAADLAAVDRARTPWVVVATHRPLYISSTSTGRGVGRPGRGCSAPRAARGAASPLRRRPRPFRTPPLVPAHLPHRARAVCAARRGGGRVRCRGDGGASGQRSTCRSRSLRSLKSWTLSIMASRRSAYLLTPWSFVTTAALMQPYSTHLNSPRIQGAVGAEHGRACKRPRQHATLY